MGLGMRSDITPGQASDYLGFIDVTSIRLWLRHVST